jgi:hypothetical protein
LSGTDIAAVLGGLALLVSSVTAAFVSVRSSRRVQEVKGEVLLNRATTNDIHTMVKQVDAAVNGKPPGETTMVQQVQNLTDQAFPKVLPVDQDALLPLMRRLVEQMDSHLGEGR